MQFGQQLERHLPQSQIWHLWIEVLRRYHGRKWQFSRTLRFRSSASGVWGLLWTFLPWCYKVHPDTFPPSGTTKASEQPANSPFGHIVLRRARHVQVGRNTSFDDNTTIAIWVCWLSSKVVHCKFCCVDCTNQVDIYDLQIWLDRRKRRICSVLDDESLQTIFK